MISSFHKLNKWTYAPLSQLNLFEECWIWQIVDERAYSMKIQKRDYIRAWQSLGPGGNSEDVGMREPKDGVLENPEGKACITCKQ